MTTSETTMITTSQKTPSTTRSRTAWIVALLLCLIAPTVHGQTGTVMPVPRQQFLDNDGNPVASGKLYTYAAGTSTPLSTYSDVSLSVANANPIILNGSGRPWNGAAEVGVFLSAASYKFVLKTSADVEIWSQDNVSSVAPYNINLDVTGTAGEALAAGDLVYLSDGSGSLTAGRWYKADSDLTYASTRATQWGMVPVAISSAASGSIRIAGRMTGLTALNTGSDYYISGTAGAITLSPPTNAVKVGRADSATTLILGNFLTPAGPRGPPCGRLTLTSGLPVTISDVTAATTLYYTPAGSCNTISLFNATNWSEYAFAELSIAVPASTSQMYDVFAYDNSGTVALELTAWTNDTTRATALALQNGVYVKSGTTTRRYLGSFRTTGVSGQTEDSRAKRYVWNYYNRAVRSMKVFESTASWTYTTATYRQARATATNQLDFVIGVADEPVQAQIMVAWSNDVGSTTASIGIGLDSTTTVSTESLGGSNQVDTGNIAVQLAAFYHADPGVGRHVLVWLEKGNGANTTTWYGANGVVTTTNSGMYGTVRG